MAGQPKLERTSEGWCPPKPCAQEDFFLNYLNLQFYTMYFTYILESLTKPGTRYIGHTSNFRRRLKEHNAGKCSHTANLKPWKLRLYIAFETINQARKFEHYLKSGSGHAFANRHFWI
jgi:putative endonuclease